MITIKGVQANGHSPNPVIHYEVIEGRVREKIKYGQSLIEWQAVTGATRYKILYKPSPTSSDYSYTEHILPDSRTSTTIRGIIVEELYELLVEAYQGSTLIGRSSTIFTFATDDALEIKTVEPLRKVAGIPIQGYLDEQAHSPVGHFDYVLCDDTLLSDNPDTTKDEFEMAKDQIEEGVKIWGDRTSKMLTYTQQLESNLDDDDFNPCNELRAAITTEDLEDDDDVAGFIYALAPAGLRRYCPSDSAGGCYKGIVVITGSERGRLFHSRVFLRQDLSVMNLCSEMSQVAIHEAGHIFGLSDVETNINTIMYEYTTGSCELTNRDIVAVKAIYQSREE